MKQAAAAFGLATTKTPIFVQWLVDPEKACFRCFRVELGMQRGPWTSLPPFFCLEAESFQGPFKLSKLQRSRADFSVGFKICEVLHVTSETRNTI